MQLENSDILTNILFGVVFSGIGFIFIFRRNKIVNALTESSDVFWSKFGASPIGNKGTLLTGTMVPAIGVIFMAAGATMLFKVIVHFLR